jgi:sugar/nucleoside kinase (ribokinase family)
VTTPAVVVLGDVMTDVAVAASGDLMARLAQGSDTPAAITVGGGGAAANVAAWLAHLGVATGLVAAVGDDGAGHLAVSELVGMGVTVHATHDPERPTGTVIALAAPGGERTMVTDRGANVGLTPDDLPRHWFRPGAHLHVSGYTLFATPARDAALAALRLAAGAAMTTSLDPASWAPLRAVGPRRFLHWTRTAGLCLPNADEARLLSGAGDLHVAARRLAVHHGEAVVTDGAAGALWSDGEAVIAVPVEAPVLAAAGLGAGDAFTAGYLAARRGGAAPIAAAAAANAVAAMGLGQPGARPPAARPPGPRPAES